MILLSTRAVMRITDSNRKAVEARVNRGSLQPMTGGYDKKNDRVVRGYRLDAVAGAYHWPMEAVDQLVAAYGFPPEAGGDPMIHGVHLIDGPAD